MTVGLPMIAFLVMDETTWEQSSIVFERTNVAARRKGCNGMDIRFSDGSCRRQPQYDKYASLGRVPIEVLMIRDGWGFSCLNCGIMCYRTTEGLIIEGDDDVYCSQECQPMESKA